MDYNALEQCAFDIGIWEYHSSWGFNINYMLSLRADNSYYIGYSEDERCHCYVELFQRVNYNVDVWNIIFQTVDHGVFEVHSFNCLTMQECLQKLPVEQLRAITL